MKGIPLANLQWICLHILYLAVRSISATTEDAPTCRVPYVSLGTVTPRKTGDYCAAGDFIVVRCDAGYGILVNKNVVSELSLQCNQNGKWTRNGWPIEFDPRCIVPYCRASPPSIPNAKIDHRLISYGKPEVTYTCDSGFSFMPPQTSTLQCKGGEWTGVIPNCEPIEGCKEPPRVEHALPPMQRFLYSSYRGYQIGTELTYICDDGYEIDGPSTLQCLPGFVWSRAPPSCVNVHVHVSEKVSEHNDYCPSVENIANGKCVCGRKSELRFCEPFLEGDRVECSCNTDYKMIGQSIITCHRDGRWDYILPSCVEDITIDSKTEAPAEESSHMSTLAIVVATACSVLGVLLLIMVIMVFRRRKPHPPRLIRPSSTPPPYSRVHGSGMDEHDRVLLIGYENTNVQLPSYEEAVSGHTRTTTQGVRSGSVLGPGQVGEYRPLPSIPSNYRSGPSLTGDTSRHSIITTSTMNRDGLSEGFGSIDTVNVSVSDASTAVTIETFDSAGSHHSNMSRRATAGSISSSNGSIVTEDAPLLESSQRTEEIDLGVNEADVQDKIEN